MHPLTPAFPLLELDQRTGAVVEQHLGMTLRDYFATKALAAMIANPNKDGRNCGAGGLKTLPGYAYEWADAMLKAREPQP